MWAYLWGGTQQIIENVDDGADVAFRTALSVLQRRVQCTWTRWRQPMKKQTTKNTRFKAHSSMESVLFLRQTIATASVVNVAVKIGNSRKIDRFRWQKKSWLNRVWNVRNVTWESARVDALAVVVHALDDGALAAATPPTSLLLVGPRNTMTSARRLGQPHNKCPLIGRYPGATDKRQ